MAKNWTVKEAVVVLAQGSDKAAIQDIARRFPLFATTASRGEVGLLEIIQALPDHITARKIESVLKADIEVTEEEEEVKEVKEKPKKAKEKPAKRGRKKKVEEVEEVEEEELEDEELEDDEGEEEGDGLDELSLPELRKRAKKAGIKVKGMSKEEIIAALRGEDDEEDEDDDDDWDI